MSYGKTPTIEELPLFGMQWEDDEPEPFVPASHPPADGKKAQNAERVLEYLKRHATGKEHAILANELVERLDLGRSTNLRYAVKFLRDSGHPVGSTIAGGYFIAADVDELKEFLNNNYKNRILAMIDSGNAMITHARVVYGEPANKIPAMKLEYVPHPELPERLHG